MTTPLRIVVTGSECTGKTTLSAWLAHHYRAPLVPEFVRTYTERKGTPIDTSDHWPIVRGQVEAEARAAARLALPDDVGGQAPRRPLLVLDTDPLSTVAYAQHYTGQCAPDIEEFARARVASHYLLLDIDVPWVADGVRDRGGQREEVHALFADTLERFGAAYTLVRGAWQERQTAALRIIDVVLGEAVDRFPQTNDSSGLPPARTG